MAALLGGLTGGGGDGGGGPHGGLTGGLGDTLGGLTGGLGGLTGGLLGSGEGLSVLGLVGIGSDEPNLLDLNLAEKKTVKAQKAAQAKKNEQKRQAAIEQLQEQVRKQGGTPTPEQQAAATQLQQSQAQDEAEMRKLDTILGPTDPELMQQAIANGGSVPSNAPSSGLFYAYLVNSQTAQPTHVVTFANAAVADAWYRQAAAAGCEKASPQMYMYSGAAPGPSGGRMAIMPINTVQPILPLQKPDGYPICCKPEPGTAGRTTTGGGGGGNQGYNPPPRLKVTHDTAAEIVADLKIARGDNRPRQQIVDEVRNDLRDACPGSRGGATGGAAGGGGGGGGGPLGAATGLAGGALGGGGGGPLGAATGLAGGALGGGGGPLDAVGSTAGGLLGGGGGGPLGAVTGLAGGTLGGGGGGPLDAVTGIAGGALGGGGGGPLDSVTGLAGGLLGGGGAGGPLGGLLGSGQGLNVAGLLAVGSDDPALLDLNPAEKKTEKLKKAPELQKQKQIQDQQLAALRQQVQQQGGKPTPQQAEAHRELVARDAAIKQAAGSLQDSMKRDEKQQGAGGLTSSLPVAGGVTSGLPTSGLGL